MNVLALLKSLNLPGVSGAVFGSTRPGAANFSSKLAKQMNAQIQDVVVFVFVFCSRHMENHVV